MKRIVLFIVVMLLALSALQTMAQEDFTFEDGSVFTVPTGWTVYESDTEENDYINIDDGETVAFIFEYYESTLSRNDIADVEGLMEYYYNESDVSKDEPFDKSLLETIEIGELEAVRYAFEYPGDTPYESVYIAWLSPRGSGYIAGYYPVSASKIDPAGAKESEKIIDSFITDNADGSAPLATPTEKPDFSGMTEYEFKDGTVFTVPDGWTVYDAGTDEPDFIEIDNGVTDIFVFQYYRTDFKDKTPLNDVLAKYYEGRSFAERVPFDEDIIEEVQIAGLDAVRYAFEAENEDGSTYEIVYHIVQLPNEYELVIGYFEIYEATIDPDHAEEAMKIIEDFLSQFE